MISTTRGAAIALMTLVGTPSFAMDDCLIGWWKVDNDAIATQFMATMQASAVSVSGEALMELTGADRGSYLVEGLEIKPTIAGAPEMTVTLIGSAEFAMQADAGRYEAAMDTFSYNAVAKSPAFGEMSFPFDQANSPFGGGLGSYECGADVLTMEDDADASGADRVVHRWLRLPGDPR